MCLASFKDFKKLTAHVILHSKTQTTSRPLECPDLLPRARYRYGVCGPQVLYQGQGRIYLPRYHC